MKPHEVSFDGNKVLNASKTFSTSIQLSFFSSEAGLTREQMGEIKKKDQNKRLAALPRSV